MRRPAPDASASIDRPLLPPRRVLVTLASLVAAIVLVRGGLLESVVGGIADQAVCNIITLILGFAAVVSLVLWFLRESGHATAIKRAVGWGCVAAVIAAVATLRIERVSGDLVPEIVPRWSLSRDRLLPRAAPRRDAPTEATPWTPTATDFPRFLGPDGSGGLAGPALDADWDRAPPRLLWRRPIGGGWSGFAVCGDHAVTLEQRGDEEIVSSQSVTDGTPTWTVAVPARHETVLGGVGPRSTPTIADGVVYATGATGWLHAIAGPTGRVLWRKNVVDDLGIDPVAHAAAVAWGRSGSPLVTESLVIVPGGGPRTGGGSGAVSLAAYDRGTGDRRWTAGDEQISYVTPSLVTFAGRDLVLAVNESSVAAYDPADGREAWRFAWPGHSNSDASCSQPHVLDGAKLFISKGYGVGAAVFEMAPGGESGPATFRPVWTQPGMLKTKFTNVVLHAGHAYGLSDGILECVGIADGRRAWKGGRYGQGQVLRVGALLLVQAESGEVVLVDCSPERHRVRGRLTALTGQTWNNPALSGTRLLVRNAEEVACFELPTDGSGDGR